MNNHKLYYLPRHSALPKASGRRDTADAHSYAPIVVWPNGSLCIPITLYLKSLYAPGSRHKGNAGTLGTYAKNLSHIVRYCNTRQILFHELDDERITEFVTNLQSEMTLKKQVLTKARGASQIRVIARRVFHFLIWLQDNFSISSLISIDGKAQARINLIARKTVSKSYSTEYYDHPSLPTPDTQKRRFPVTTPHIEQLFQANIESTQSAYVKRRRSAMIQLARATGARRIEMNSVKVSDIRQAYETGSLSIAVKKTKRHKIREIPILKTQILPIIGFIDGQRSLIVKKTVGIAKDPGNLFLSAYGKPLSDETLTNDMHDIATLAGFITSVCLHMFRHRYFTDMAFNMLQGIREFVERKELTAPTEQIVLQQMRAISQHENEKTLLGYIHAAYKEAKAWDLGERLWQMSQIHDSMISALVSLRSELNREAMAGLNKRTLKLISEFDDQLDLWRNDLMQVGVDHGSYSENLL